MRTRAPATQHQPTGNHTGSQNGLAQLYRRRALLLAARVRAREAGLSFLTTFRRVRFMTMLGISGVELPDRRPYPVSSLRLG